MSKNVPWLFQNLPRSHQVVETNALICDSPESLVFGACFIRLRNIVPPHTIVLKLEGFSVTGSIKIKTAKFLLDEMERAGKLKPGARIIESSSGNLGIALSMLCAARGYGFVCISDPNIATDAAKMIRAYNAELIIVKERDANGGYLQTRLSVLRSMLARDPDLRWTNQYENIANNDAHYATTGPEILSAVVAPDYVFIGAGTTGTLGGVSQYLRERSPSTKIIAVDSVGSVTFGGRPGRRKIPGLGSSTPPALRQYADFDDLVMIEEKKSIAMCRLMAQNGLLVGGSTGTVLQAVRTYANHFHDQASVVAISPDLGDRYLDTIFSDDWILREFRDDKQSLPECETSIQQHAENRGD